MNLSHDGLSLWYGTADAPAPSGCGGDVDAASLTIGVAPAHVFNVVSVRYRTQGGAVRTLPAFEVRTDHRRDIQYFKARFPDTLRGKRVEYCPVVTCSGRQVPAHGSEDRMLSAVSLDPLSSAPNRQHGKQLHAAVGPHFTPTLAFVGHVSVRFKPPSVVGETPEGLRVDFYAQSGSITGDCIRGRIAENSADYLLVRPDGIGLLDVHARIETNDGAVLSVTYRGQVDFGEDGYQRVARNDYPTLPRLQVTPRILTQDQRYRWMNRTQFVGVGHVDMPSLLLEYDWYSVKTAVNRDRG